MIYSKSDFSPRTLRIWAYLTLVFVPLLAACGNLSGEPNIVMTFPTPIVIDETLYPVNTPDLVAGQEIYEANCTRCHGASGDGNGELVLSGQMPFPGDFTDPASIALDTPLDYFRIITNGRLGSGMPPWNDALSLEDRWHVTFYVFMLHYRGLFGESDPGTESSIAEIESRVGDLTEIDTLLTYSDTNLANMLGDPELSEEQKVNALAYARASALGPDAVKAFLETTLQTQEDGDPQTGIVRGTVENATPGNSVPESLSIELSIYNAEDLANPEVLTTSLNSDGTFEFPAVPVRADHFYIVSADYNGRSFATPFEFTGEPIDTRITLYEVTNDPSVLTINRIVTEIVGAGDILEIRYQMVISNSSDRMYSSDQSLPDGRPIGLEIPLPPASALVPDGTNRFVQDANSPIVYDTRALLPGVEQTIDLLFLQPFDRAAIFEYEVPYTLSGPVIIFLENENLTLSSEQLEEIDREAAQIDRRAFAANLNLQAGELIRYEIGGTASIGTSADNTVTTSENLLPVIAAGVAALLVLIGLVLFMARRGSAGAPPNHDALIDGLTRQIEQLDIEHDAGRINHDVYRRKRAQLRERLDEIMNAGGE